MNTIPQIVADPQISHRGMIKEVTHEVAGTIPIANTPLRLSRNETGIKGPPPSFGADTRDVLEGLLGLDDGAVAELEARGVVATTGGPDIASITG